MKMVRRAHGMDDNVGESAIPETLGLDVITQRGKVTVQSAQLNAAPIIIGVGGRRQRL